MTEWPLQAKMKSKSHRMNTSAVCLRFKNTKPYSGIEPLAFNSKATLQLEGPGPGCKLLHVMLRLIVRNSFARHVQLRDYESLNQALLELTCSKSLASSSPSAFAGNPLTGCGP